jgi:hypothetical protein
MDYQNDERANGSRLKAIEDALANLRAARQTLALIDKGLQANSPSVELLKRWAHAVAEYRGALMEYSAIVLADIAL